MHRLAAVLRAAIASNARSYLNPPIANFGAKGIRKAARAMPGWFDTVENAPVALRQLGTLMETEVRREALDTYQALKRDWSRHLANAERTGIHALDAGGCDRLRVRMEALAQNPALDDGPRQTLARVLGQLDAERATRRDVAERLAALDTYEVLKQDWSRHLAGAEQAGVNALDRGGYDRLRVHMEALAQNPALDGAPRQTLRRVIGQLDTKIAARRKILSTVCWLGALVCGRLIAFAWD